MIPLIIVFVLAALDQLTKAAAYSMLRPVYQVRIIDGFFYLTYLENRGAAFGAMQGARWMFVSLAAVLLVGAGVYYRRIKKTPDTLWLRTALVMLCSGTIGNVIDRVFRGYVVDFLDFIVFGYDFPVFNVADMLIVGGTALLVGGILVFDKGEKR